MFSNTALKRRAKISKKDGNTAFSFRSPFTDFSSQDTHRATSCFASFIVLCLPHLTAFQTNSSYFLEVFL